MLGASKLLQSNSSIVSSTDDEYEDGDTNSEYDIELEEDEDDDDDDAVEEDVSVRATPTPDADRLQEQQRHHHHHHHHRDRHHRVRVESEIVTDDEMEGDDTKSPEISPIKVLEARSPRAAVTSKELFRTARPGLAAGSMVRFQLPTADVSSRPAATSIANAAGAAGDKPSIPTWIPMVKRYVKSFHIRRPTSDRRADKMSATTMGMSSEAAATRPLRPPPSPVVGFGVGDSTTGLDQMVSMPSANTSAETTLTPSPPAAPAPVTSVALRRSSLIKDSQALDLMNRLARHRQQLAAVYDGGWHADPLSVAVDSADAAGLPPEPSVPRPGPLYRLDLNIKRVSVNTGLLVRCLGAWPDSLRIAELNLLGVHPEGIEAGIKAFTNLQVLRVAPDLDHCTSYVQAQLQESLSQRPPARARLASDASLYAGPGMELPPPPDSSGSENSDGESEPDTSPPPPPPERVGSRYMASWFYALSSIRNLRVLSFVGQGAYERGMYDSIAEVIGAFLVANSNSLVHIDLSNNAMSKSGLAIIGNSLQQFPAASPLRYLDLTRNGPQQHELAAYAAFWKRSAPKLQISRFHITLEHAMGIISVLPDLRELHINYCNISYVERLLPKALAHCTSLEVLDLTDNNLSDEGLIAVADSLRDNRALRTLLLKHNPITARSIRALTSVLQQKSGCKVVEVDLNDPTLQTVVKIRREFFHVSADMVMCALRHSPSAQERVDLHDMGLTLRDVPAIVEMLQQSAGIRSLDLSGNPIGSTGVNWILNAIQENQALRNSLHDLDFSETGLDDDGCQAIGKSLALLPNVTGVHLHDNHISDAGATTLAHSVELVHAGRWTDGDEKAEPVLSGAEPPTPRLAKTAAKAGGWARLRQHLRDGTWLRLAALIDLDGNRLSDEVVDKLTGPDAKRIHPRAQPKPPPKIETVDWCTLDMDPTIGCVLNAPYGAAIMLSPSQAQASEPAPSVRTLKKNQSERDMSAVPISMDMMRKARAGVVTVTMARVTSAGQFNLPKPPPDMMIIGSIISLSSTAPDLPCGQDGAMLEIWHALSCVAGDGLRVLHFEGYPTSELLMKDLLSYSWTVLPSTSLRCPREGIVHVPVSAHGYYAVAWDWTAGRPKQRVQVLTFTPNVWGAGQGVAPLYVFLVPFGLGYVQHNRTVRHIVEELSGYSEVGGVPLMFSGDAGSRGVQLELGAPVVVRVGHVEHCVSCWDGQPQSLPAFAVATTGRVIGDVAECDVLVGILNAPHGNLTRVTVRTVANIGTQFPIVDRRPAPPANLKLIKRHRATTVLSVQLPSPYLQRCGPARFVCYIKQLTPGEYADSSIAAKSGEFERVPVAESPGGYFELPNVFYAAQVYVVMENLYGESSPSNNLLIHPSNQCADLRYQLKMAAATDEAEHVQAADLVDPEAPFSTAAVTILQWLQAVELTAQGQFAAAMSVSPVLHCTAPFAAWVRCMQPGRSVMRIPTPGPLACRPDGTEGWAPAPGVIVQHAKSHPLSLPAVPSAAKESRPKLDVGDGNTGATGDESPRSFYSGRMSRAVGLKKLQQVAAVLSAVKPLRTAMMAGTAPAQHPNAPARPSGPSPRPTVPSNAPSATQKPAAAGRGRRFGHAANPLTTSTFSRLTEAMLALRAVQRVLIPPPITLPWRYVAPVGDDAALGHEWLPMERILKRTDTLQDVWASRFGRRKSGKRRSGQKLLARATGPKKGKPAIPDAIMLTAATRGTLPENLVVSENKKRLARAVNASSISETSLRALVGCGPGDTYELVNRRCPEHAQCPMVALMLLAFNTFKTAVPKAMCHMVNAVTFTDAVDRLITGCRAALLEHYSTHFKVASCLLPILGDALSLVSSLSRPGWLRLLIDSAATTQAFQNLDRRIAAVFLEHCTLPGCLPLIAGYCVRRMYIDTSEQYALLVLYMNQIILAERRTTLRTAATPVARMITELCQYLGSVSYKEEVNAVLRSMQRKGSIYVPNPSKYY